MRKFHILPILAAGLSAGIVNGLLGGGGGMILVPLLSQFSLMDENEVFPSSVAIILPICAVSLLFSPQIPLNEVIPYLAGSFIGGIAAGIAGRKIPVLWLHRGLGALIIYGGIRYLCNG